MFYAPRVCLVARQLNRPMHTPRMARGSAAERAWALVVFQSAKCCAVDLHVIKFGSFGILKRYV